MRMKAGTCGSTTSSPGLLLGVLSIAIAAQPSCSLLRGKVKTPDARMGERHMKATSAPRISTLAYSEYQLEISYLDGLGREAQRLSPIENSVWARRTMQYGFRGQRVRELLSHRVPDNEYVPASEAGVAQEEPTLVESGYDAFGRVTGSWLRYGSNRYDEKRIAYHPGWTQTWYVEDASRGRQRHHENGFGNLVKVEELEGDDLRNTVEYRYDVLGNRLRSYQNGVLLTRRRYNSRGLVELEADANRNSCGDPASCPRIFTYDALGRLESEADATGKTVVYKRDELGRAYRQDYCPDGACEDAPVERLFDGTASNLGDRGQLVRETKGSVVRERHYDHWGRTRWEKLSIGSRTFRTDYTYDLLGRVLTITYPSTCNGRRERAVYTYDALGLRTVDWESNCEAGSQRLITNVEYDDALGRRTEVAWNGGVTVAYEYDPRFARLKAQELRNSSQTLGRLSYDYFGDGKIQTVTDEPIEGANVAEGDVWTHDYDYARRLSSAVVRSQRGSFKYRFVYGYDAGTGNLNRVETKPGARFSADPQRALELVYGEGHAGPHAVTTVEWRKKRTDDPELYAIEYDDNGAAVSVGNGHVTYGYDADGRMTRVEVAGCPEGLGDCDGFVQNGCEADVRLTCGNCKGTCPNGMECTGQTCECAAGRHDCNGDPSDGCEGDLRTPTDCGSCGNSCSGNSAGNACVKTLGAVGGYACGCVTSRDCGLFHECVRVRGRAACMPRPPDYR